MLIDIDNVCLSAHPLEDHDQAILSPTLVGELDAAAHCLHVSSPHRIPYGRPVQTPCLFNTGGQNLESGIGRTYNQVCLFFARLFLILFYYLVIPREF